MKIAITGHTSGIGKALHEVCKNVTDDFLLMSRSTGHNLKTSVEQIKNDIIDYNPDIIFNIGHLRSYSNFLELDTDTIIQKFKDQVSFNNKEEKKNITPIVENHFFKIEKFFAASLILAIFTSFYFLFVDQNDNEINFALIPDIPESLEPIVEKANTFGSIKSSRVILKI